MRQGPLSERLQDAIASEIAFSGALIDDWPTALSTELRSCIPLVPAVIHPDLIEIANQAFQPGCPYELQRVGPDLNPFQYAEGRA